MSGLNAHRMSTHKIRSWTREAEPSRKRRNRSRDRETGLCIMAWTDTRPESKERKLRQKLLKKLPGKRLERAVKPFLKLESKCPLKPVKP